MDTRFFHLQINPEPWAIGPLSTGRNGKKIYPKIGRNAQLYAFQQAIKEELSEYDPLDYGQYDLHFFFWRQIARYTDTAGRTRHRNTADATNMQKATEDALQGILIDNDRNVKRVGSTIVKEGPDVIGQILIQVQRWYGMEPADLPAHAWEMIDRPYVSTPPLKHPRSINSDYDYDINMSDAF